MKIGDICDGQIISIKPYGAFVKFDDHSIGLIHISEVSAGYIENIFDVLKVGEKKTVQVIDVDDYNHKVSLSLRALETDSSHLSRRHRFSNNRCKAGFKPLKENLPIWIDEALTFLKYHSH